RIDRGEEVVVGVNKYRPDGNDDVEIRAVDNTAVREQQIARLRKLRETRDDARVQQALQRLTDGAASNANLLELSIDAVRARATEEAASEAIENDVHVVGVSSQAAGHKTLVPELIQELRKQGGGDVLVVCGGVIPPGDYDFLLDAGVAAIYGPGTNIPHAAAEILDLLRQRRRA